MDCPHIPVLLDSVLDTFHHIIPNSSKNIIIDCTLGFGSMSSALLDRYEGLEIIGIDRDIDAINYNRESMKKYANRFSLIHDSFATALRDIIKSKKDRIVGILADLGVSSYQLDNAHRGFSFHSSRLDMRMDLRDSINAEYILNHYTKPELERIFRDYGEIAEYKKLASLITSHREKARIDSEIMQNIAMKIHSKRHLHPLTLIYQALRIEVNNELGELESLLDSTSTLNNALICIISFHSLEDRIIKTRFKQWTKSCICPQESFKCECGNNHSKGTILYKKPLVAKDSEIKNNSRARSAKLRAFHFTNSLPHF